MTIDLDITSEEGTSDVRARTSDGEVFVDAWVGGITQVIDSGHIVIPREALPEFVAAAEADALTVEQTVNDNASELALKIEIGLGNAAMLTPKDALDALDRAFTLGTLGGSPYHNYIVGDAGPIMDVNGNTVGRWYVDAA